MAVESWLYLEIDVKRFETFFFPIAALGFFATGWIKLVSSMGASAILNRVDPVFGFNYRFLFTVGAMFELIVAFCLLWPFSVALKRAAAFSAFLFLGFYRLAYTIADPMGVCPCLGNLTDKLPVSPQLLGFLLVAFLISGLIASGILFFLNLRTKQAIGSSESECSGDQRN